MDHIDRSGGCTERWAGRPDTVFIFDIFGAVHEVVCDRGGDGEAPPRRSEESEIPSEISPAVIRRWLAGLAVAIVGLALSAEPGAAVAAALAAGAW